MDINHQNRL
jgi:hypothetical protein